MKGSPFSSLMNGGHMSFGQAMTVRDGKHHHLARHTGGPDIWSLEDASKHAYVDRLSPETFDLISCHYLVQHDVNVSQISLRRGKQFWQKAITRSCSKSEI